ncbi:MAG: D-alanyl-D-alanine endopeptidase [Sterolibacterium sp.]|nr:D-alanyl-D-alanine endopeptidase [Sterolibacterium sp.]MBP9798904.1 D-alanyl-D-alanine endopeptidase [Sterolibacterium sp.]
MNIYRHSGRRRGWLMAALLGLAVSMGTAPALAAVERHKSTSAKKHRHHKVSKAAHKKVAHRIVHEDLSKLTLSSNAAMVLDQATGAVLFEKNAGAVLPIASITKLMTAMVALDARPDLEETMVIDDADVDTLKGTHSRLKVGTQLQREDMLRLALMSSENRAASALSRYYPGGRPAFVAAMNRKAQTLGLQDTHFADPTGLTAQNVSSARDLAKMVGAAQHYPLIRQFTTTSEYEVTVAGRTQEFRNTNSLVRSSSWDISLSKTGYINEAGRCLVMQAWLNNKPTIIVLLDSIGKMTRLGDANRIKHWVENGATRRLATG